MSDHQFHIQLAILNEASFLLINDFLFRESSLLPFVVISEQSSYWCCLGKVMLYYLIKINQCGTAAFSP
jgi:hypothetical protein